jgi:hypothetical protein
MTRLPGCAKAPPIEAVATLDIGSGKSEKITGGGRPRAAPRI